MLREEGMQESVTAWRNSLRYLGFRVFVSSCFKGSNKSNGITHLYGFFCPSLLVSNFSWFFCSIWSLGKLTVSMLSKEVQFGQGDIHKRCRLIFNFMTPLPLLLLAFHWLNANVFDPPLKRCRLWMSPRRNIKQRNELMSGVLDYFLMSGHDVVAKIICFVPGNFQKWNCVLIIEWA